MFLKGQTADLHITADDGGSSLAEGRHAVIMEDGTEHKLHSSLILHGELRNRSFLKDVCRVVDVNVRATDDQCVPSIREALPATH
jgi:hypothetical protein